MQSGRPGRGALVRAAAAYGGWLMREDASSGRPNLKAVKGLLFCLAGLELMALDLYWRAIPRAIESRSLDGVVCFRRHGQFVCIGVRTSIYAIGVLLVVLVAACIAVLMGVAAAKFCGERKSGGGGE
jgi:hypothetical protein